MDVQQHFKRVDVKENETEHQLEKFIEDKFNPSSDGLGSKWKFWRRRRYTVIIMVFLGEVTKGILRSNLSIAVFPMTENYTITNANGTEIHQAGDFDWDAKTRGFLLSVFYYGHVATNIPGGILAVKYGGARLFGLGVLLTSITTLLTPAAARVHLYLLIAVRIFEGMCEGVLNPSAELLLASWVPSEERSSSLAALVTGSAWGHVISIAVSSAIGSHWGWEAIFYFTGGVGVVWCLSWKILVKDHPKEDRKISSSELAFIRKCGGSIRQPRNKVSSIPFKKIVTSLPVWAIILTTVSVSWSNVTYITQIPAYIKDVLKVSYENSGYVSSLTFGLSVMAAYFTSPIADLLISKNILSVTAARKTYICVCFAVIALLGFLLQHMTSATSVIVCLAAMQIFTTMCVVPAMTNCIDIAPKYASVLTGFAATAFSICGMITPTVIGYLTQFKEWHTVFSIQSGICLLGAFIYGMCGSGDLQPWASDSTRKIPREERNRIC